VWLCKCGADYAARSSKPTAAFADAVATGRELIAGGAESAVLRVVREPAVEARQPDDRVLKGALGDLTFYVVKPP
jgi:hypothetical protein